MNDSKSDIRGSSARSESEKPTRWNRLVGNRLSIFPLCILASIIPALVIYTMLMNAAIPASLQALVPAADKGRIFYFAWSLVFMWVLAPFSGDGRFVLFSVPLVIAAVAVPVHLIRPRISTAVATVIGFAVFYTAPVIMVIQHGPKGEHAGPTRNDGSTAQENLGRQEQNLYGHDDSFPSKLVRLGATVEGAPVHTVKFSTFHNISDGDLAGLSELAKLQTFHVCGKEVTDAILDEIAELKSLRDLSLSNTSLSDAGLARLAGFSNIQILDVSDTKISVEGLQHLSKATSLKELYLTDHLYSTSLRMTDADLQHFSGLPQLERFKFSAVRITDAGLVHLGQVFNLRNVCLGLSQVTDAGMENLSGLTRLDEIDLRSTKVTGKGLQHFLGNKQMRAVLLDSTRVGDDAMAVVGQFPDLRKLSLENTVVGNVGMAHLESLADLEELNLKSTNVTDGFVKHLRPLTKLASLRLDGCAVSDLTIEQLAAFPHLQANKITLDFYNTHVSKRGYTLSRSIKPSDGYFDAEGWPEPDLAMPKWTLSTGNCNAVAFSPDGMSLATLSSDAKIAVWQMASGEKAVELELGESIGRPAGVTYSADGSRLFVSGMQGFEIRDANDLKRLKSIEQLAGAERLSLSANARLVSFIRNVGLREKEVVVFDLVDGQVKFSAKKGDELADRADSFVVSRNGELIVIADTEGIVSAWNVSSGEKRFGGNYGSFPFLALSGDGEKLVIRTSEGMLVLDAHNGRVVGKTDDYNIDFFVTSPTGHVLFGRNTLSTNYRTKVYDYLKHEVVATLGSRRLYQAIACSPTGNLLVTADAVVYFGDYDRGTARIWDLSPVQKYFK